MLACLAFLDAFHNEVTVTGFDNIFHYLTLTLEVFLLDVLLSGDNAVVIALACRTLPPAQMRRAMWIGTTGAIALRILLTAVASLLLLIPLLKLVGGIVLIVIAIKLIIEEDEKTTSIEETEGRNTGLWSAIGTIIVADVVMSVDNVLGLAAITQGSLLFLVLGLLMSVPLLMFGSLFVGALLKRYPLLIDGGGVMLGWVAGEMVISDPMIADWVNQQSPALTVVVPILVTVFVLIESRIMKEARPAVAALRPKGRVVQSLPAQIEQAPARSVVVVSAQSVEPEVPLSISDDEIVETASALIACPMPVGSQVRNDRVALSVYGPWIGAALSILLVWPLFSYVSVTWMPKPVELNRYYCKEKYSFVFYRHGNNTIRMVSSFGSISGTMRGDHIDWGDDNAARKTLGFSPPTFVQYGDTQLVRLDGGLLSGIDCLAQPVVPLSEQNR